MKAIKITQTIKDLNDKFISNMVLDDIKVFNSIPKQFVSQHYNANRLTDGYNKLDESIHEQDGFLDYYEPVSGVDYDESIEKLGDKYKDEGNNIYTREILDKTQQEQDNYVLQQENNVAQTEINTKASDGDAEARYIFRMLTKLRNKGTLTPAQFLSARHLMFYSLIPLKEGLWDVAEIELNEVLNSLNTESPNYAKFLNIMNNIISRITYYITNGERQAE